MLETLRKSATGWVAKIFIGLLVISFAVWGIADIFRGYGTTTVATIGETEVPVETFRTTYNRELRQLGQRLRRPVTAREAAAVGLPQQVLSRLVNEATLNEEARRLKLGLSDEKLAESIRSDPNLQGLNGKFDRNRLQDLLFSLGMNEAYYLAEQRRLSMRQQLAGGIGGGFRAPDAYLEAINQYVNEERTISYIALPISAAGEIPDPSEDDLKAYYEAHKADFRAPEYRKLTIISVNPEAVADPKSVEEADIQQTYDTSDAYFTPEKRFIRQIVFQDEAAAQAAAARLKSGASFEDIAAERNLTATDTDLGLLGKSEVLDPAIAEAAFSMTEPGTSGVIDGRFGTVIVNVKEIQPEQRKPLAEVRDQIALDIAVKLAEGEVLKMHDEIEDARAGGATLAEIADRFGLTARTIDAVDATGKDPEGNDVQLPIAQDLLQAAFDSDVGVENDPLQQSKGFVWYDVQEVTPARDRSLEEARDKVVAAWHAQELDQRLGAKVTELTERLKEGAELSAIAGEVGTEVKTAEGLKRNAPKDGVDSAIVAAAFRGPEGDIESVKLGDGSRVILKVTAVAPPVFFAEAADMQQIREQLNAQIFGSVLAQYVTQIQERLGVTINQQAVVSTLGLNDLQ